ncbi:hypothetical protein GN958_ATG07631 [Phytophthora infestans]|uniref:Uncharacterized protein n=1 Tax=Phytophthora infestans TaxID=4787 RepID=A0A8S9UV82_PHYIN|nr:hypothetical protein GN958_ATG07631 [Phytophthora infestans]
MAAAIGSVSGDVGGGESAGGDGSSDRANANVILSVCQSAPVAPYAATLVAVRAQAAMAAAMKLTIQLESTSTAICNLQSWQNDDMPMQLKMSYLVQENLMQFRPLQRKKQSVNEKLSTATGPPMKLEPDVKRRKTS